MRPLLKLALCGAVAAPAGGALAQELPAPDATPAPVVATPLADPAPLEAAHAPVEPGPPVESHAPPAKAEVAPTLDGSESTTVAPVIVEGKEAKDSKLGRKAGTIAGGVIGGVAGAAVAGPVGKIAGGLVGKRLVKGIVGGKDKGPRIRAAETAPSADQAAAATAELSSVPPLREAAADPEAATP